MADLDLLVVLKDLCLLFVEGSFGGGETVRTRDLRDSSGGLVSCEMVDRVVLESLRSRFMDT